MSDVYSLGTQFSFVDSQFGTGATSTGIKKNVPIITDIKYHKKVQIKLFWAQKGLIGGDGYVEGSRETTTPGFPVIRKTDFQGKRGDTLVMHQRTNLAITDSVGKVGNNQMVNNEVGWDLNYKLVKIEQWRQGVLTVGAMNEQRNPIGESFEATELDLLSDWSAQVQDSGLFLAMHYGHSGHLMRQYGIAGGTTGLTAGATNLVIGNDTSLTTSNTIAALQGASSDDLKAISIELMERFAKENFFDPVSIAGDSYYAVLVSARGWNQLFRDADFRLSMQYARERGIDNPLFKNSGAVIYSNCLVINAEKIRTIISSYNPAGLTVNNAGATNSSLTHASYTGIGGGIVAANLHQTYLLGANALALGEGRMRMGDRKEDDYGQFIGRDADNIWGASRMDFTDNAGNAAGNQSSALFIHSLS